MSRTTTRDDSHAVLKMLLFALLIAFSAAAIIFSLVVLFTDLRRNPSVSSAQARGMFTVFAYSYIDEVHPQQAASGAEWQVTDLHFANDHFAVVEASDGKSRSILEFIYTIESPNVRVLKINDVSDREVQDAQLALTRYLDFLRKGEYALAAELYGGGSGRLAPYGDVGSGLAKGFAGYCTTLPPEGACMDFKLGAPIRDSENGTYSIPVHYMRNDGTPYTIGTREFVAVVEKHGIEFTVITLPFD